jgi:hypothetical protein
MAYVTIMAMIAEPLPINDSDKIFIFTVYNLGRIRLFEIFGCQMNITSNGFMMITTSLLVAGIVLLALSVSHGRKNGDEEVK